MSQRGSPTVAKYCILVALASAAKEDVSKRHIPAPTSLLLVEGTDSENEAEEEREEVEVATASTRESPKGRADDRGKEMGALSEAKGVALWHLGGRERKRGVGVVTDSAEMDMVAALPRLSIANRSGMWL